MRIPVKSFDKTYLLTPYNTNMEKEALLVKELIEDKIDAIDETLRIFNFEKDNFPISDMTLDEKKFILYQYRSYSVGDSAKLNFTCSSCEKTSSNKVRLDVFRPDEEFQFDKDILQLDYEPNEDNLDDFLTKEYKKKHAIIDIYDLEIEKFERLLSYVKSSQIKINFIKPTICSHCSHPHNIDCGDFDFILDNLSEMNISSIYEQYVNLTQNGWSKADIDQLIPFERSIVVQMIIESMESNNVN